MKIKELLSPSNWRNFITGNFNWVLSLTNNLQLHLLEQAQYRAFLCRDCLANGKCNSGVCSCATPGMFFAPNKVDGKNKWGSFKNQKDWEEFKEKDSQYKEYEKLLKENNVDINTPEYYDFLVHYQTVNPASTGNIPTIVRVSNNGDPGATMGTKDTPGETGLSDR